MSTDYLMETVNNIVEDHLNKEFERVYASRENIGLDPRAGVLYVSEDAIAVDKSGDGTLQYYGGFEYVDREYRTEIGDYVFYLAGDSRVNEHLDRYYGIEREDEE